MVAELAIAGVVAEYVTRNSDQIIDFLYVQGKKAVELRKQKEALTTYINEVYRRSRQIKSYYFRDQSADLYDFYVPLDASIGSKTFFEVDYGVATNIGDNLIISGTGGSGKSMLMRHLFLTSISNSSKIPVFFELRELNNTSNGLFDSLCEYFTNSIKYQNKEVFNKCMEHGKFVFFLDGFDEISNEKRQQVAKELVQSTQTHKRCQFFVSSRPDSMFNSWHSFTTMSVNALSKESAIALVEKLPHNEMKVKKKFLKQLESELYDSHESFCRIRCCSQLCCSLTSNMQKYPRKLVSFITKHMRRYSKDTMLQKGINENFKVTLIYKIFRVFFRHFLFSHTMRDYSDFHLFEHSKL